MHQETGWIEEIKDYLKGGDLPEEDVEAERIARQAKSYCLYGEDLYRKRPNGVALKCVPPKLIRDIHSGECGHHSSSRTLAGKVFKRGFYWPSVLQDAATIVQSCEGCQFHTKQVHQPAVELQISPLSWPFAVWGVDILGPFLRFCGGYRFLYVVIDKFTKWVEMEPARTIPTRSAIKFIRGIACRFRVPNRIITDDDSQFTISLFRAYYEQMGTRLGFAS